LTHNQSQWRLDEGKYVTELFVRTLSMSNDSNLSINDTEPLMPRNNVRRLHRYSQFANDHGVPAWVTFNSCPVSSRQSLVPSATSRLTKHKYSLASCSVVHVAVTLPKTRRQTSKRRRWDWRNLTKSEEDIVPITCKWVRCEPQSGTMFKQPSKVHDQSQQIEWGLERGVTN
jgi:hypothetical protein